MARANSRATKVRTGMETALACLMRAAHVAPVTAVRLRQARQRSGLESLLAPAEDEFGMIVSDIEIAQAQVSAALALLVETLADGGDVSKLQ